MTLAWRVVAVSAILAFVSVFAFGVARVGADLQPLILAAPGILTPLVAALVCLSAARRSAGADRRAWLSFAVGCLLYLSGNVCYLLFGLYEVEAGFPTLPELLFFVMAGFFTVGMFQYGAVKQQVSRAQLYDFVLIFAAVALAMLFVLHNDIGRSGLTPLGTAFAVTYPVLWFSVACFGLVCLLFYVSPKKRVPFALLVVALFLEAAGDLLFAHSLLNGTFDIVGPSAWLWFVSTATIVWAAAEQRTAAAVIGDDADAPMGDDRREALEAMVPAITTGGALLAAGTGAFFAGYGTAFLGLVALLAAAFATTLATREAWLLAVRRRLTDAVRRGANELNVSREQLSGVLESTTDSVLVLDNTSRVVFFNGHAARMLGDNVTATVGRPLEEYFTDPVTAAALAARFQEALHSGSGVEFEHYLPDTNAWWEIHAFPSPEGLSVFSRDISETRRSREEMTYLAHHDVLTGLANRAVIRRELQKCIASGQRSAAIFLDLDNFKEVNDNLGHPVGDALLQALAERLSGALLGEAFIGRLGGDGFAIVQPHAVSKTATAALAQLILDTVSMPFVVEGRAIAVRGSLGIALMPDDGTDPDEVFRRTDIALNSAKAGARGSFRFFNRGLEDLLKAKQRFKVDLAQAIERGQLELNYQPVIDLTTGKVSYLEALLRWRHPIHGQVSPEVFIPIAEETGLIVSIGAWVLEQACAAAKQWPASIGLAVNLSSVQFADANLLADVSRALAASGLAAQRLELEITESTLLKESRQTLLILSRLRALGIGIALDDFGTGYASLGYLQKFAFSRIKIDRSFVVSDDRGSYAIMAAVTALGHELGARITAEGVETATQVNRVRRVGCDEAQGFHFSRPLAEGRIADFFAQYHTKETSDHRAPASAA